MERKWDHLFVYSDSNFKMYGGEISNNTSVDDGGGVSVVNSTFEMSGGKISGNNATGNGGGVAIWNAPYTLSGGEISNNNATGNGGGVYFNSNSGSTFQISGAVNITGNVRGGTIASGGLTGGTPNNVYLPTDKYLIVADELTGSTPIGVTTEAMPDSYNYVLIAMGSYADPSRFQYENNPSIDVVRADSTDGLVVCVHKWSEGWSTDNDKHWHTCSICNGKKDVTAHAYDQEFVNEIYKASDATCTAKATYYKSCVCGQMGTDTFESGELLAHDFVGGAWQSDSDHHWKKCANCDATDTPNPHEWGSGTVTTQPTCTTVGERTYICDTCHATKTETIDANGHDYTVQQHDETQHWKKCANCDAVDAKAAHTGGTATCTEKAKCATCGAAYGNVLGHDFVWKYDADKHWKECSHCNMAEQEGTHNFSQNGRTYTCTDCGYVYTVPSSSGSGSSGTPTITVPVTGSRDTVQVSVSVSGSTAEVKEIKKSELDKIGTDRDVVIDLSGLSKSVTGVTLPTDTIRSISESEADGVTIKLPQAELRVDQQTLAAVSEQAKGSKVQLVVETDSKAKSTMTAAQKSALDGMKNAAALEAYFVSNGQRIRDFNGGEVELSVPYQATGAIRAWYLKEDGTREPVSARYDKENARLILRHFSHYVIEELDSSTAYTVCAKDNTCPLAAFGDLTATAWYHDGVHYCLENGLMQGVSTARFLPDGSTTRAQLVTILWRLEGSPETTGAVSFGDVADSAWYAKAVRWAAGSGVVKGYDSERFGPDDAVTREQMVTILYRCAQYKGYDVSVGEDTNILSFADALTVSEYAIPAMQWACGSGLVTGIAREGGTFLAPADTTVRVQTATLMMRFPGALVKTV